MKLVLHYDGRNFYGWQVQRNRRTVQGELSSLLGRVLGTRPTLSGAGRTDRGVHATGQVASALIPERFTHTELRQALNALAPPDLWVASAEPVTREFDPRRDAISRTYVYRVGLVPESASPFRAPWCWPLGRGLELDAVEGATAELVGAHDFGAFSKSGQPQRGERCEVFSAVWRPSPREEGTAEFEISANRFLHHMVRYLADTLVGIGSGHRGADEIGRLLRGDDTVRPAAPAPANGLWLTRVDYPESVRPEHEHTEGG